MIAKKSKIIISTLILTFVSCLLSASYAYSATPSPLPSQNQISTDSADLEKIQKIKNIVASKVKELKLVEKRGIIGKIKEIKGMGIVITDVKDNTRHIDVDELTKFDLGSKTSYGITDLEKGKQYSYVGLYNKETEKLLARTITTTNTIPVFFEGAVLSVDTKKYQLNAVNAVGDKKTIDIQSSTKTSLATVNGDLEKSGFTKFEANERVLAVGFWDKKDNNLLSTLRIIHFSDIPPSKEMQSHVTVPSPTGK